MSTDVAHKDKQSERVFLLALAACCIGPMLLIIVLTSVAGFAIGPAAAITLGLVAAMTCLAVMVVRHRSHGHGPAHRSPEP